MTELGGVVYMVYKKVSDVSLSIIYIRFPSGYYIRTYYYIQTHIEFLELAVSASTDAETKAVEEEEQEEAMEEQKEEEEEEKEENAAAESESFETAAQKASEKLDDNKLEANEDASLDVHVTENDELDADLLTTETEADKPVEVSEEKPAEEVKEEEKIENTPEPERSVETKPDTPADDLAAKESKTVDKKDDKDKKEMPKSEPTQKGKRFVSLHLIENIITTSCPSFRIFLSCLRWLAWLSKLQPCLHLITHYTQTWQTARLLKIIILAFTVHECVAIFFV